MIGICDGESSEQQSCQGKHVPKKRKKHLHAGVSKAVPMAVQLPPSREYVAESCRPSALTLISHLARLPIKRMTEKFIVPSTHAFMVGAVTGT